MKGRGVVACMLVAIATGAVGGGGAFGCSDEHSLPVPASVSVDTTTVAEEPEGQQQVIEAFRQLAEAMPAVTVFGLESLPSGMDVAAEWWPVLDQAEPRVSEESVTNPRVEAGASSEPEGQLLLSCGDGWLAVLENFRGDLGDVTGESVGFVAGRPANLYQVNGGWLVQWSLDGRWYGVFGRGVPRDVVTSTALSMMRVERY
jgi:hypothetical protein